MKLERSKSWMNKAISGEKSFHRCKGVIPDVPSALEAPWRVGWALAKSGGKVEDHYLMVPAPRLRQRRVNPAQDAIDGFEEVKAEFEAKAKKPNLSAGEKAEITAQIEYLDRCIENAQRTARVNVLMGGISGNRESERADRKHVRVRVQTQG